MLAMQPPETVNIFYCYAHEDKSWQDKLQKHLSNLRWQKLINDYRSRDILAGQDWQQTIDAYLDKAHIIIILISSDFMSSDYYYGIEMMRAMERHKSGEACVIPILLRPVDVSGAPFSRLQMLPADHRSVKEWGNTDKAFEHITLELRKVIFDILGKPDYVDELLEQPAVLVNPSRTSRATRASVPRSSNTPARSGTSKQISAQVLSDTGAEGINARSIRRSFPTTYKNSMLDNLKELIRGIDITDFFRFLVTTSLNRKKFRRYGRGNLLLVFCFFMICDVIIATAGIYFWPSPPIFTMLLVILLVLLFLWNSYNDHTFTGVVLSLLFGALWFVLGMHYLQSRIPFLAILLGSSLSIPFRLLLIKPKK